LDDSPNLTRHLYLPPKRHMLLQIFREIEKAKDLGSSQLLFDFLKSSSSRLRPFEFSVLKTISNQTHNSVKSPNKPPIQSD